jgi:hypothetical protein
VNNELARPIPAIQQWAESFPIRGSFKKARYILDASRKSYRLIVKAGSLRKNVCCFQIDNENRNTNRLLKRRPLCQLGLVNRNSLIRNPAESKSRISDVFANKNRFWKLFSDNPQISEP